MVLCRTLPTATPIETPVLWGQVGMKRQDPPFRCHLAVICKLRPHFDHFDPRKDLRFCAERTRFSQERVMNQVMKDLARTCINTTVTQLTLQGETWASRCQPLRSRCKHSKESNDDITCRLEGESQRNWDMEVTEDIGGQRRGPQMDMQDSSNKCWHYHDGMAL